MFQDKLWMAMTRMWLKYKISFCLSRQIILTPAKQEAKLSAVAIAELIQK